LRRWGFAIATRGSHRDVGQRLSVPVHPDLALLSGTFHFLSAKRNKADYDLSPDVLFSTATAAIKAVTEARDRIALLDAFEANPTRRSAIVAAIRVAFP
jgi:hypothetical protein